MTRKDLTFLDRREKAQIEQLIRSLMALPAGTSQLSTNQSLRDKVEAALKFGTNREENGTFEHHSRHSFGEMKSNFRIDANWLHHHTAPARAKKAIEDHLNKHGLMGHVYVEKQKASKATLATKLWVVHIREIKHKS